MSESTLFCDGVMDVQIFSKDLYKNSVISCLVMFVIVAGKIYLPCPKGLEAVGH